MLTHEAKSITPYSIPSIRPINFSAKDGRFFIWYPTDEHEQLLCVEIQERTCVRLIPSSHEFQHRSMCSRASVDIPAMLLSSARDCTCEPKTFPYGNISSYFPLPLNCLAHVQSSGVLEVSLARQRIKTLQEYPVLAQAFEKSVVFSVLKFGKYESIFALKLELGCV